MLRIFKDECSRHQHQERNGKEDRKPGAKTIKKNTNSTQNKSQTHRAKQYEVTSLLSTNCELSTETCSKNVYSLGTGCKGLLGKCGIKGGGCTRQNKVEERRPQNGRLWEKCEKREFEAPTPAITQAAEHSLCMEVDDDESASCDHPLVEVSQVLHIEDVGPPSSRRVDGRDHWRVEARLLGTHCSYRVRHRPGGH